MLYYIMGELEFKVWDYWRDGESQMKEKLNRINREEKLSSQQ